MITSAAIYNELAPVGVDWNRRKGLPGTTVI